MIVANLTANAGGWAKVGDFIFLRLVGQYDKETDFLIHVQVNSVPLSQYLKLNKDWLPGIAGFFRIDGH